MLQSNDNMSFLPPRKPLPQDPEAEDTEDAREPQESAPRLPVPVGSPYVRSDQPDDAPPVVYDASLNGDGSATEPWTFEPPVFEAPEEQHSSLRLKKLGWELAQTLLLAA